MTNPKETKMNLTDTTPLTATETEHDRQTAISQFEIREIFREAFPPVENDDSDLPF